MDSKELKGLFEAYNEVYLDEALPAPGTSSGSVTMYGKPRASYVGTPRNTRFDRPRNANTGNNYQGVRTSSPKIGSLPPSTRKVTQYPQGVSTGVGGGNAGGSRSTPTSASRPSSTAPRPQALAPRPTSRPSTAGPSSNPRPSSTAPKPPTSTAPKPSASTAPKPSTSAAPTPAAKPASSPMDQWAKANPRLAAAAAEKSRIRGTQQTDNPLMKDMKSNLPMNSPSVQSSQVSTLGKGNQSLINNPNALRPSQKKTMKSSYDFGKPDQISKDVADLYQSIYEAKKKVDQDQDGDNDFADVQIAKMIASGMSKEEAIRKVRNKSYNEEAELEEAAARVPKKVRGYKDAKGYMAGRSDAGKRISGDEKSGPGAYTSRMYAKDKPVQPGSKPNSPKVTKSELTYARTSYNSSKGRSWNKFGGTKGLPGSTQEDFELWVNDLLDESYDLSEYTVDEMYEIFEETELERRKKEEERKNERRARVAELTASGRVLTSSKRTSAKAKERAAEKRADALEKAAQKVINSTTGRSGRVSEKPMGSEPPAPKAPAPEANRRLRTGLRKDTLGTAADQALKATRKEEFELYELVIEHLLDEGFADDYDAANTMIENMSDEWLDVILKSKGK